jgi:uncharacterized RDD family membrane protein YckC
MENVDGARFCENCGALFGKTTKILHKHVESPQTALPDENDLRSVHEKSNKLVVANSDKRFMAWLIDLILSYGILTVIVGIAGFVAYGDPNLYSNVTYFYFETFIFGIGSLGVVSFFYFLIAEYFTGTTIGKTIMGLTVVSATTGKRPSLASIILNSAGKSFAFVFDVFAAICFVHYDENETNLQQRVSQSIAKIVVIEVPRSPIITTTAHFKNN